MQTEQQPSESHQKIEDFKNEIRNRMKNEYMKKIRSQFLTLENSNENKRVSSIPNPMEALKILMSQKVDRNSVGTINRIIIEEKAHIPEDIMERIIGFLSYNLIGNSLQELLRKNQLNDLIALLGNMLAIDGILSLMRKRIQFGRVLDLLIQLVQNSSQATGNLVLWLLFQFTEIVPHFAVERLASLQLGMKNKFGIYNVNFSYLLCGIAENRADLIEPVIVEEYCSINLANQTKYFVQNITVLLNFYMKVNKNPQIADKVIGWISSQLCSSNFKPEAKTNLLKLLLNIVKFNLAFNSLLFLLSQSTLIYEIVQRGLYDNMEEKIVCLMSLNEIIRQCPEMQLEQLISNYPSIITALVSSLSLLQHHLVIGALISIGKIVTMRPCDMQLRDLFLSSGLQLELEVLKNSQNKEVEKFAVALLDNYLE